MRAPGRHSCHAIWRECTGGDNIASMEIELNGAALQIDETTTVAVLLEQLDLVERRVAVEVNREIVPRSRHALHRLVAGDQVEIVHAIGGG